MLMNFYELIYLQCIGDFHFFRSILVLFALVKLCSRSRLSCLFLDSRAGIDQSLLYDSISPNVYLYTCVLVLQTSREGLYMNEKGRAVGSFRKAADGVTASAHAI